MLKKWTGIFLTLYLLIGSAAGLITLETGIKFGSTGDSGYYEVNFYQVNYSTLTINTTNVYLTGLSNDTDAVSNTTGLLCRDANECLLGLIGSDEKIYINDFIENASSLILLNITGTNTDFFIYYNSTGEANLTIKMDDLGNDCNYGLTAVTGNTTNIKEVHFDRAVSAFYECTVILETNSTTQTGTWVELSEDESASEVSLSTIIAATAATITLVTKAYIWDTKT
jgi:hypothetical protein